MTPICPYCDKPSELTTGKRLYPNRKNLHGKYFYRCEPCNAQIGCFADSYNALGLPANPELRYYKQLLHKHLHGLWNTTRISKRDLHLEVIKQLDIRLADYNIHAFDIHRCISVIEVLKKLQNLVSKASQNAIVENDELKKTEFYICVRCKTFHYLYTECVCDDCTKTVLDEDSYLCKDCGAKPGCCVCY